jgi:TatD DNase family protein
MLNSWRPVSTECWVDTNVHLERLGPSPDDVVSQVRRANIAVIASGTQPEQWRWLQSIRGVGKAYGLHPEAIPATGDWLTELRSCLLHEVDAAVGEVGLDWRPAFANHDLQVQCLRAQLALAIELDRAVILHVVKAHQVMLAILRDFPGLRFTVHAFTGSLDIADQYLALGGYLSAGGLLTRKPAPRVLSVFATMPEDRILLESDAPDLPIAGQTVSDPCHLPEIARVLAAVRGVSTASLAIQTQQNARVLFGDGCVQLG